MQVNVYLIIYCQQIVNNNWRLDKSNILIQK